MLETSCETRRLVHVAVARRSHPLWRPAPGACAMGTACPTQHQTGTGTAAAPLRRLWGRRLGNLLEFLFSTRRFVYVCAQSANTHGPRLLFGAGPCVVAQPCPGD